MSLIYKTQEWSGHGKQNYFWNEYRLEGSQVVMYKCNRHKFFDGNENNWVEKEEAIAAWNIEDASMPNWIKQYL